MVTNQFLHKHASERLNMLESSFRYLPFNRHDWDDLKQTIMIRIFQKKNLIKEGKSFKPYINRLVKNSFKNYMRDTCGQTGKADNTFAKYAVKFPKRMLTKVVQDGMFGEETIYEPDFPETLDNISQESRNQVQKIIDLLPPNERLILQTYESVKSWEEASKKLNLSGQMARRKYKTIVNDIKRQLQSF